MKAFFFISEWFFKNAEKKVKIFYFLKHFFKLKFIREKVFKKLIILLILFQIKIAERDHERDLYRRENQRLRQQLHLIHDEEVVENAARVSDQTWKYFFSISSFPIVLLGSLDWRCWRVRTRRPARTLKSDCASETSIEKVQIEVVTNKEKCRF